MAGSKAQKNKTKRKTAEKKVKQKKMVVKKQKKEKNVEKKKRSIAEPKRKQEAEKKNDAELINELRRDKRHNLNWLITILKKVELRKKMIEIGGEETIEVLKGLTKYSLDEEISKKFSVKISDVRAVLNKLNNYGIVKYIKTKDTSTSWFIYNWYIDCDNLEKLANEIKNADKTKEEEKINPLEYYFCPTCMTDEIPLEEAYQMDFKCPICSNILQPISEREKFIKTLKVEEQ